MTDTMVHQYLASDAARAHYDKYGIGGPKKNVGSPVDPREARITKLEAEVEEFQKAVFDCGRLIDVMLTDLLDINRRYRNAKTERDMLAKRLQELLAAQGEPAPSDDVSPILAAIDAHQKQGVR